jgi:hypothetical protein
VCLCVCVCVCVCMGDAYEPLIGLLIGVHVMSRL